MFEKLGPRPAPGRRLVSPAQAGAQLLALLLPLSAVAGGLDDFLAFNQSTKTATARFEQQVVDRNGKVVERASGTFAFARPGKFRWTYEKPHKQLLVGDGAKLWIHDPDLNQVTVKRIDQAISSRRRRCSQAVTTSPSTSRCATAATPRASRGL